MLKNYLITAWRNIARNKAFSLINILGLALGMACSLFIMLWVRDERSIDSFHENSARLFSVYERQYFDGRIDAYHVTPGVMADEIKKVIPEIQYACGFAWKELNTFAVGDKKIKDEGYCAGADFFKMFSYPLLKGNAQTALNSPVSIAISRKMAKDFFGDPATAMGKTIRYQNRKDLQVTAVFEDLPSNTSEKFNYLINWQTFLDNNSWATDWSNNGPRTFIMLRDKADPASVETKIKHFLDTYNKDQNAGFRIELGLQQFSQIYLHSNFKNGRIEGGRIEYVRLFSVVALFVLLIACINFMNLTTARSVKRAREIGVRKVVGAVRSLLIPQFIGEAILLAFLATLVAVVVIILFLPAFNNLTGKLIKLPLTEPFSWMCLAGLTLVTGFISGSYPALFLSSFKPMDVLKGTLKFGAGALLFRKGLVVFQFILSIVLIIGTIVVSDQVAYIQTKNLGYDRENLVYIPLEGDLTNKYDIFKQETFKVPGIKTITRISQTPTQMDNGTGGVDWVGKEPESRPMFTWATVGYDFVKTMNLTILQGRDFSKDFAQDSVGYVINESALEKIGYKDPIGRPLTFWQKKGTILGILKDFHFDSFREPIKPLVLRLGETDTYGVALVRIERGKTKQALVNLERICKDLNPNFPFTYQFSDEEYQKLYKSEQLVNKLSDYFAFLGIFISCLGLLGLVMFTAQQRLREISIRKVLGASVGSLFSLLSKDFIVLVLVAFVIGCPIAWWAMSSWLQDFAYKVPIKWWVFLLAGCTALLIALLTVSVHAIKAAIVKPVKNLRTE